MTTQRDKDIEYFMSIGWTRHVSQDLAVGAAYGRKDERRHIVEQLQRIGDNVEEHGGDMDYVCAAMHHLLEQLADNG